MTSNFHQRWAGLKPPLRPNNEIVAALRNAIQGHAQHVLLLGVTPELVPIGDTLVAVDKSERMISLVWPGDTPTRHAVLDNWLTMPPPAQKFSAVIGDGSIDAIRHTEYETLFAQLEATLLPGAVLAVRIYERPDPGETVAQVRQQTLSGKVAGFHAFKWRLAMAVAAERGAADVPVTKIHDAFEKQFHDRAELSRATGWSLQQIGEIDAYVGQASVFSFPTRREILTTLPRTFANPRFAVSGTYELAERCPIFIADFAP